MTPKSVTVIAEAGVNHNGDPNLAIALVDAAVAAGADIVKFQSFRTEAIVSPNAPKAAYQQITTGASESQFAMLKRLELSNDAQISLQKYCHQRGIRFLSTPFDLTSLRFLAEEARVDTWKIGSGDLTNAPILLAASRYQLPIILSTGMATLGEIEEALGVVAFGYTNDIRAIPSRKMFAAAFASDKGRAAIRSKVTLLHCTTEYPAPVKDVNLRAMATLRSTFDVSVGLSDHTEGIAVSTAAIALGASIIEKHLTLDKSLPGPDHAASLTPDAFAELVKAIRTVEMAVGDGEKRPMPSEIGNASVARKSLVAACAIAKGEIFSMDNLATLRPGAGISAMEYFDWLGRPSSRAYAAGEMVRRNSD